MPGNGMVQPFSSNTIAVQKISYQPAGQNGLVGCDGGFYSERARNFRRKRPASVLTTTNWRSPDAGDRAHL